MRTNLYTSLMATALVAACADMDRAENGRAGAVDMDNLTETADGTAQRQSPVAAALRNAADRTLMTLSGTVVSTAPSWFRLDVGGEEVTVEMDDWDWFQEGQALKAGDRVSVTGRVDKGLWEQGKIEASSVYVRNLGVTFFASGADEEETAVASIPVDIVTAAQGLVTNVEGQEFTVGAMTGPVRVDSSQLKKKPKVKLGDRIYSWGKMDLEPSEGVELMADGIVVLSPDRTKKDSSTPIGSDHNAQPSTAERSKTDGGTAQQALSNKQSRA